MFPGLDGVQDLEHNLLMQEKRLYLVLGGLAVFGVVLTGFLAFKASRLGKTAKPSPQAVSTESAASVFEEESSPSAILADLILDFGEEESLAGEKIATFSGVRSEKGTALDLLLTVAEREGFLVDYEEENFGAFIKGISGVENSKESFWLFYIDGQMAPVAADKQRIENGNRVEFRYQQMKAE